MLGLILSGLLAGQAVAAAPPGATPPAVQTEQPAPAQADAPDVDNGVIDGRRRPGMSAPLPEAVRQSNPGAVRAPPPEAFPTDQLPLPDRWRILTSLCPTKTGDQSIYSLFGALREVCHSPLDPYHQNTLKGDRAIDRAKVPWLPIKGDDWFFEGSVVSDTVFEPRSFPIPTATPTTQRPNSIDAFSKDASYVLSQTVLASAVLTKGSTAFKPPEIEYHLTLGFNFNYAQVPERQVLNVDSAKPPHRTDGFVAVQEAFIDYHLRNVSTRYDFDSVRVGIQPFQADFRGFLFNDDQLGIRVFGDRDNNRMQYNLAVFRRLEKDTNSGLNRIDELRQDYVFVANLYRQDFLIPSFTSQVTVVYNLNREGDDLHFDTNGFPVRPALLGDQRGRNYDVVYLGYNADGHIGRINATVSSYLALGSDRNSNFTGREAKIRSFFGATELSYDHDWVRFRLSGLYASGDRNPRDNTEHGFDAIYENPVFAGADTSYWIRQSIPFVGGGRAIGLSGRNGVLADLRSSKDEGQSNFTNPGTVLGGVGADFDITPRLRVATNANHLWFAETEVLKVLRQQGNIAHDIGWDLSMAATYRPRATQNIVMRLSGAMLVSGKGTRDLFTNSSGDRNYYSVLANVILAF